MTKILTQLKTKYWIIVFLLSNTFFSYSQSIIELTGIQNCFGMLNNEILFCDTSKITIDHKKNEILYPDFTIKNIKTNTNNFVYLNSKRVASSYVIVRGRYLIILPKTLDEAVHLAKCDDDGSVNKDFGKNGFIKLPKMDFIDLTCDSIGNIYILAKQDLDNGLEKKGFVLKYSSNGKPSIDFGSKGILTSNLLTAYHFNKIYLQNKQLSIACNEKYGVDTEVIFNVSSSGKSFEKSGVSFSEVVNLEYLESNYIYVVKKYGIEIYDQNILLKTILETFFNNVFTEVLFNENNKKTYVVIRAGLEENVSKIYEIQNDFSVKLLFSSDQFIQNSIEKDDFIKGISFSSTGIDLVLGVKEFYGEYAYSNYLIHLD